jgi:hypothetical protein
VTAREPVTWRSDAEKQVARGRSRWRPPLFIAVGMIVALAIIGGGVPCRLHARHFASGDDAFVGG